MPIFLAGYYLLPKKFKNLYTVLASYIFYGWGSLSFLWFLIAITIIGYGFGFLVAHSKHRKLFLTLAITLDLGTLAYFKYSNFFFDQLNQFNHLFGFSEVVWQKVALPLGISFFTFHGISYLVDIYRKKSHETNFIDFALYIALFPQLIAGPIIRFHEIAAEIKTRTHTYEKFFDGIFIFSYGLGMKVILANPLGQTKALLATQPNPTALTLWLSTICYAFQIYFDFAGYSAMARGLGKMIGFDIPINFNRPYLAKSITEFWQRWHISLLKFLREYVYFPLGGSRVGLLKNCRNILIVFLLSGIWHGANWTFIFWGVYFGIIIVLEKLFEKSLTKVPGFLRQLLTFLLVLIGWIFFDAASIGEAFKTLQIMFTQFNFNSFDNIIDLLNLKMIAVLMIAAVCAFFPEKISALEKISHNKIFRSLTIIVLFSYSIILLTAGGFNPFIYFHF